MAKTNLDVPFDMQTRYLHGVNVRLDAVIDQLNSIVEFLASKNGVAVTNEQVREQIFKEEFAEKAHEIVVQETKEYNQRKSRKK